MTEAEQERARVVAWLREISEGLATTMTALPWKEEKLASLNAACEAYAYAADSIDRGDHLKGVE